MDGEAETDEDRVLAELEAEIAREREIIASLTDRSRVLEVETRSWVWPAPSKPTAGRSFRDLSFVAGFMAGGAAGSVCAMLLLSWIGR